jgi:hypothetical protein
MLRNLITLKAGRNGGGIASEVLMTVCHVGSECNLLS